MSQLPPKVPKKNPAPESVKKVAKATSSGAHAKRSPSSAKSREQCSGFDPRQESSQYSDEGHLLHRYMELWVVINFPDKVPPESRPSNLEELGLELNKIWRELNDEQIDQITKLIGFIESFCEGAVKSWTEVKLDLRPLNLPGCDFGTADLVTLGADGVIHAFDYKFGKVEVDDAQDNAQAWIYTLGIFTRDTKCSQIDFHILQPRLDIVTHGSFPRTNFDDMHLRAIVIFERCQSWEQLAFMGGTVAEEAAREFLSPNAKLCEYCRHVGTCTAVQKFALKMCDPLEIPEVVDPEAAGDDPHVLGNLMAWAKILVAKGEALEKAINAMAAAGHDISGYLLINAQGQAQLTDPLAFAEDLAKTYELTPEQIYSCSEISMSKVIDLIVSGAERGTKKKLKTETKKNLLDGGYFRAGYPYSYLKRHGK